MFAVAQVLEQVGEGRLGEVAPVPVAQVLVLAGEQEKLVEQLHQCLMILQSNVKIRSRMFLNELSLIQVVESVCQHLHLIAA